MRQNRQFVRPAGIDAPQDRQAVVPIGLLELQIAYKLHLGAQKDLEDAVHLYTLFKESLRVARLEEWVTRFDVEAEYERLTRA